MVRVVEGCGFHWVSDLQTALSSISVSVLHVLSRDDLQRNYLQVRIPLVQLNKHPADTYAEHGVERERVCVCVCVCVEGDGGGGADWPVIRSFCRL